MLSWKFFRPITLVSASMFLVSIWNVSFVPTNVSAWALKIPPSQKSRYLMLIWFTTYCRCVESPLQNVLFTSRVTIRRMPTLRDKLIDHELGLPFMHFYPKKCFNLSPFTTIKWRQLDPTGEINESWVDIYQVI